MLGSGGDGAVTSAATPRPGPPTAAEAIAASIDTGAAPPPAPANKPVRPVRNPATSAAAAAAPPGRTPDASTSHVGTVARRSASSYPASARATNAAWPSLGSRAARNAAASSGSGRWSNICESVISPAPSNQPEVLVTGDAREIPPNVQFLRVLPACRRSRRAHIPRRRTVPPRVPAAPAARPARRENDRPTHSARLPLGAVAARTPPPDPGAPHAARYGGDAGRARRWRRAASATGPTDAG